MTVYHWAERKPDNTFTGLRMLEADASLRMGNAKEKRIALGDLRVVPREESIQVTGMGSSFSLTPWSFSQLCQRMKAPASYLKDLPPHILAENLNVGIDRNREQEIQVLSDGKYSPTLRAINGRRYSRLYDAEIMPWVWDTIDNHRGWRINALRTSDRSTHITLVHDDLAIRIGNEELYRGLMISNSEVGAACFVVSLFWFRWACTNGLIFGQKNISEFRTRHTGEAAERARHHLGTVLNHAIQATYDGERQAIDHAIHKQIASSETEAERFLLGHGFTRDVSRKAVLAADKEEGEAGTLWSIVNGLTAVARGLPNFDSRAKLEREAGSLLLRAA